MLLVPALADSLAGRMEVVRLHPLSQAELAAATGQRFAAGAVLYDGEITAGFGPRLRAVPIRRLWETSAE